MTYTYTIVVIALAVFCVISAIRISVKKFIEYDVNSPGNTRNRDYKKEEYTRNIIAKKYGKGAEKIMRDAYDSYRAQKKTLRRNDVYKMFARAYRDAIMLAKNYMDEDDIDYIKEIPYTCLSDYSIMYGKFFGDGVFDPYSKIIYAL